MRKKIILYDHECLHVIVEPIETSSKNRKSWNPPVMILLKQVGIQSGDGSGNEGSGQGFWQSGLGS